MPETRSLCTCNRLHDLVAHAADCPAGPYRRCRLLLERALREAGDTGRGITERTVALLAKLEAAGLNNDQRERLIALEMERNERIEIEGDRLNAIEALGYEIVTHNANDGPCFGCTLSKMLDRVPPVSQQFADRLRTAMVNVLVGREIYEGDGGAAFSETGALVLAEAVLGQLGQVERQRCVCNIDGDGTPIYPDGEGAPDCPVCGGSGQAPPPFATLVRAHDSSVVYVELDGRRVAQVPFGMVAKVHGFEPAAEESRPEAHCSKCKAPKGLHAVGESCNTNCGGRVVAAGESAEPGEATELKRLRARAPGVIGRARLAFEQGDREEAKRILDEHAAAVNAAHGLHYEPAPGEAPSDTTERS